MENDKFYHPNWNSSNFGIEIQTNELNCSSEQLQNCFFNPNWDTQMDQNDPFESALSSMVSSPVASSHNDATQIRELIGKLGTICNSREISPPYFGGNNSTNNSCYSTPLNSPPKLNLSMTDHHITGNSRISGPGDGNPSLAALSADPGFAERAARFSCFGSRSLGQFGLNESELPYRSTPDKLSRAPSSHSLKVNGSHMGVHESKDGDSRENSSVTEQIPGGEIGLKGHNDGNVRKRKSIPRGKGKEKEKEKEIPASPSAKDAKVAEENDGSNAKRSKSDEENGNEKTSGNSKQTKDNSKPPEPPKDYIHVRARRGQATDSHSLAERVRREKISERMKFLQDLVPGCNKVTGKAVMLDEIINYVQSLQKQVEFLSMKLATVNPRMDFNVEALLSKEIFQARAHGMYSLNSSASAFSYGSSSMPNEAQLSMNPLSLAMRRNQSLQLPNIDGFVEAASLVPTLWGDDLQSVVEMTFGQNQTQTFQSSIATANMKIEQ